MNLHAAYSMLILIIFGMTAALVPSVICVDVIKRCIPITSGGSFVRSLAFSNQPEIFVFELRLSL